MWLLDHLNITLKCSQWVLGEFSTNRKAKHNKLMVDGKTATMQVLLVLRLRDTDARWACLVFILSSE